MHSQKIKTVFTKSLLIFSLALAFASCGNDNKNQDDIPLTEEEQALDSIKRASAENVFYSIPSPIEITSLLKKSGALYDKSILNPIENKDKYSTLDARALNLGVYGADLSYTTIFDNSQESMLYLACAKNLADGLGITNAFDASTVDRMEVNMGNKDSLLNIISQAYWEMDVYLQENDRPGISALIIAGGWIEALYISTRIEQNLRKTNNNQAIVKRIGDQKQPLENLIDLIRIGKDEVTANLTKELKELKLIFDGIESIGNEGEDTFNITQEQINNIADKIGKIRTAIIQ